MPQQYKSLLKISEELSPVNLNFETLQLALKTSMAVKSLSESLSSVPSEDPEEETYFKELIEEHAEHCSTILEIENQRLRKNIDLVSTKNQLAKEMSSLGDLFSSALESSPDLIPAKIRKSSPGSKTMDQKTQALVDEQDRVRSMK